MKLQLALDLTTTHEAIPMLAEIIDLVDIIEIGTPLIMLEGVQAVTKIKKAYPQVEVLADLKIVDAGEHEAKIGFDAGADIVTVLGVSNDATIQGVVSQARRFERQVMVDLITIKDVQQRATELEVLGCDYVCVHTGTDAQEQGHNPLAELALVSETLQQTKVAVAGGIKPTTLPDIILHQPAIVVVGGYITNHPDKRQAVLDIRAGMEHL